MKKETKGLAIIYDPHSLQQFLWYYFTYAKDVQWDALCLPNGYKGTYMTGYCQKARIFKQIYRGNIDYLEMGIIDKLILFIQMIWHWATNSKSVFAKKVFDSYVDNVDEYNEIISLCDTGFVSGLSALLWQEKKISFCDDGLGDYAPRTTWSSHYKKSSFTYLQGLLMSFMGYGCKGRFYFEPTKYCYKYSAITSEMKYHNYKYMLDMDMSKTDIDGYNCVLRNIYSELYNINFCGASAIVFTDKMDVFSKKYQVYYDKCTSYISERHMSCLLKKHPRDDATYKFNRNVAVVEIDSRVPAEVLLPFIHGKKIFFLMFSSIIIFMNQYKYSYEVFYSEKFYNENKQERAGWKFHSREELVNYCERFSKGKYTIIDLD